MSARKIFLTLESFQREYAKRSFFYQLAACTAMARISKTQAAAEPQHFTRLADLALDGIGSADALPTVTIHNFVATASYGCEIDLERLSWLCMGEFNPRTFRAVKLRLTTPKSTALVFSSGKVVCTGNGSECAALTALHVYLSIVRKVHPSARMCSIKIQNIVASATFHAHVRLEELARAFMLRSAFDPELFPGLRLKLRAPRAKILVFCGGKVVITGCRNRADVARAWAAVQIMVAPYIWRQGTDTGAAPTHMSLTVRSNLGCFM